MSKTPAEIETEGDRAAQPDVLIRVRRIPIPIRRPATGIRAITPAATHEEAAPKLDHKPNLAMSFSFP